MTTFFSGFHFFNHVHAFNDFSEHNVFSVQPRCGHSCDKELRAVRVLPRIGHRHDSSGRVTGVEVFVAKVLSIYAFAACAVATSKIASLDHEIGDYPVERRGLVVQRHAGRGFPVLACAESTEVFSGFGGDFAVEPNFYAAQDFGVGGNVQKNVVSDLDMLVDAAEDAEGQEGEEKGNLHIQYKERMKEIMRRMDELFGGVIELV
jgi:hypothetical protein